MLASEIVVNRALNVYATSVGRGSATALMLTQILKQAFVMQRA